MLSRNRATESTSARARRAARAEDVAVGRGWPLAPYTPAAMDAKELNALVHDREAAFYDDRFLIAFDGRIGKDVERDLQRIVGGPVRSKRALDLACGTGYAAIGLVVAGLAEEVHATDLSIKMLERCRDNAAAANADVRLALADAERLPYEDDAFDLVVARGALHHVPSPDAMMREIRRVLAPDGTAVVLAEPTAPGERQVAAVVGTAYRAVEAWRKLRRRERDAEHERWEMASIAANLHTFAPADVERLARDAGFTEVRVGTASWAWVLTLGLNYYFVGESERLARSTIARATGRRLAEAAAAFDRSVADRVFPASWRHTVQAVLR